MKYFQNFGKINTDILILNIKKELTNSDVIMPNVYFWMGLQHLIFDNFKTPISCPTSYMPQKDLKVIQLKNTIDERTNTNNEKLSKAVRIKTQELNFKSLFEKFKNDKSVNFNFEQYNYLSKIKSKEYETALNSTEKDLKEINLLQSQYDSKMNFIKDSLKAHTGNNSADYSLLFELLFVMKNAISWKYNSSLDDVDNVQDVFKLIDQHHQILTSSNKKDMAICFNTGITFKKDAHQICFIITNEPKNQFLIFDPNFGLFSFKNKNSFYKAIKDLTQGFLAYKTIKYELNVYYLNA